eukprot:gene37383-60668_t
MLADAFQRPAVSTSPAATASIGAWVFHAHPDGRPLEVRLDAAKLSVGPQGSKEGTSQWALRKQADALRLEWPADHGAQPPEESHLLAAIEAAFVRHPELCTLSLEVPPSRTAWLVDVGAASAAYGSQPSVVSREAFWQLPRVWQRNPREPFAQRYTLSQGRRHPMRPAKPVGTVYQRHIPWLSQTLTLDT